MKTVYACFTTDVIHAGHLNIIREAQKYGRLIAGVMSDAALVKFDRFPTISQDERMALLKAQEGVSEVVLQDAVMYDRIIEQIKPDYVIHGDNWLTGPQKAIRDNAEKALAVTGGQIIDVPYTYNDDVKRTDARIRAKLMMPEFRRRRLRQLLQLRPIVKAIEVHSGLTGLLAEKTVVEHNGELDSLTHSGSARFVTRRPRGSPILSWWT